MTVECYAQRLLNPFRGAMHTIRHAAAEAVTTDGVHWDIYVSNDALLDNLDRGQHTQISDIRYGKWCEASGLKRGPIYPSEDFLRMEAMGAVVYEHLTRLHRQVPFAFRDRFELWLLDAERRPLALLHSAIEERELAYDHSIEWRAGLAASERFSSPAMHELSGNATNPESAGDYLARYVNVRAGSAPAAQWFRREADGSGAGLRGIGLSGNFEGRTLPESDFPLLFLADTGHDAAHRELIADFHAWQAAWLLVLPRLGAGTRRALEQSARKQAAVVEAQFRLYPEVIDEAAIKAALVEAILRRSAPKPARKDDTLSTFYIELNPYTCE